MYSSILIGLLALGTVGELDFKPPLPAESLSIYNELVEASDRGNKNATFFLNRIRAAYAKAQKEDGKKEPEAPFIGCLAYQIGGLKALDSINIAVTKDTVSQAIITKWSYEQRVVAWKVWVNLQYYEESCYGFVHDGFVAEK